MYFVLFLVEVSFTVFNRPCLKSRANKMKNYDGKTSLSNALIELLEWLELKPKKNQLTMADCLTTAN